MVAGPNLTDHTEVYLPHEICPWAVNSASGRRRIAQNVSAERSESTYDCLARLVFTFSSTAYRLIACESCPESMIRPFSSCSSWTCDVGAMEVRGERVRWHNFRCKLSRVERQEYYSRGVDSFSIHSKKIGWDTDFIDKNLIAIATIHSVREETAN